MIAVNASLAPLIPFLLSATYNPGAAQRFFTPPTSIHARFQILPPCSLTNDTFPLSPGLISLDPSNKCAWCLPHSTTQALVFGISQ